MLFYYGNRAMPLFEARVNDNNRKQNKNILFVLNFEFFHTKQLQIGSGKPRAVIA